MRSFICPLNLKKPWKVINVALNPTKHKAMEKLLAIPKIESDMQLYHEKKQWNKCIHVTQPTLRGDNLSGLLHTVS
jgi:hypothetical protein